MRQPDSLLFSGLFRWFLGTVYQGLRPRDSDFEQVLLGKVVQVAQTHY